MSQEVANLEPKILWKNFTDLNQVPRPSKKEERVIAFIKDFGENLGLETLVDESGNVIIRKPATPGMENRKGVVLQSHLDMVHQKNSDTVFDFDNDPIQSYVDGDWVKARGTTLGSDNGMGVAAAMSVLASQELEHGPIEALFTIDEETGMTGAFGLKPGVLQADIMLNMDSEDEGELYVGCAGGGDTIISMNYTEDATPSSHVAYKISVTGLKGGHSGIDIPLGRGNSNKIMARLFWKAHEQWGLRLTEFDGGSLRNAIPREAFAIITLPSEQVSAFQEHIANTTDNIKAELSSVEPDLNIQAIATDMPGKVMNTTTQGALIKAIYACPNGVIRMSNDIEGLVETSTNLAKVKMANGQVQIDTLQRSSVDSAKKDLQRMIRSAFELAGATVKHTGSYPGWKPNMDSPILSAMKQVYDQKFGKVPEVKAIHAGLECGIINSIYPNLDCISFGPTIRHPHSPDEKVHIGTVEKFWDFLVETLKHTPNK